MDTGVTLELVFRVYGKASFKVHIDTMNFGTRTQEREIEEVSVKCGHNGWLDVLNVREESLDGGGL